MLGPTRGENVLDLVLSSQNELVDNVKIVIVYTLEQKFKHFDPSTVDLVHALMT